MKRPRLPHPRHSLSCQLREVIDSRGLSAYALAKLSGVDRAVILRFVAGERDIQFATADRLAAALGLRLVEVGRARPRTRPATSPATESSIDLNESM